MRCAALSLVALTATLASCAGSARPVPSPNTDWRAVATPGDRDRLSRWRDAWISALPLARRGRGAGAIAAEPVLFDYDRALADPMPPAGDYRCRVTKLGAQTRGGLDYVAYPWFRCRVVGTGETRRFEKIDGSQRPVGRLYPAANGRVVFLGTLELGDEGVAKAYGRDRDRDMAGWLERIGPARWRLAFPYPRYESLQDVMELVPVS